MGIQLHHVAVQVSDIGRAVDFYTTALDGHLLVPPTRVHGGEALMGGPPGSAFTFGIVGLDAGAIELFEFEADAPDWAKERVPARVPHIAVRVDDVGATLDRIEALGGGRLWPAPRQIGGFGVVYAADPDQNTIELIDASLEDMVRILLEVESHAALPRARTE